MTKGQRVGYIRVSTAEQNPDRQLQGVELDKRFVDHATGSNTNRPAFREMMNYVREGDTVFVHEMCRLARKLSDLESTVKALNQRGVIVHFLREHLIFTGQNSYLDELMMRLLGSCSQFFLDQLHERQMEGIAIAKKKGKFKGRKPPDPNKILAVKQYILANPRHGIVQEACKQFKLGRSTAYKYIPELKERHWRIAIPPEINLEKNFFLSTK